MPTARAPLPNAPVALPFELAMNHVLLRPRVNGMEGWFILDTGSSMSALDAEWATEIGARKTATQARVVGAGDIATSLATVDTLTLAGIELRDRTMVLVPLD